MSVRRNVRRRNVLSAKCPRRNVRRRSIRLPQYLCEQTCTYYDNVSLSKYSVLLHR